MSPGGKLPYKGADLGRAREAVVLSRRAGVEKAADLMSALKTDLCGTQCFF